MDNNQKKNTVAVSVVIILLIFLWFFRSPQKALTLNNVIIPNKAEPIMNFSCSPFPCKIIGQKTNSASQPLYTKVYNLSISQSQINDFSDVEFVAHQGDVLEFNFISQDKSSYYFFMPRSNLSYESRASSSLAWVINTLNLEKGDYQILLQDSLNFSSHIFQAAVIRIE